MAAIRSVALERGVTEIVVGLPINMDGSMGPQAKIVEEFAEKLGAALGLPVSLVDERLSSRRAERTLSDAGLTWRKAKGMVDRMAAQFILEQYMALRRTGGG